MAERPGIRSDDDTVLEELGEGLHGYFQKDGGWGWSNAGLVVAGQQSLLVDTLFDLRLTRAMLDAMAPLTAAAPIGTLVNTHANGDHCYGNAAIAGDGVKIVASAAAAAEMDEVTPELMAGFLAAAPNLGPGGAFVERIFGQFEFDEIEATPPTDTFTGEHEVTVGEGDHTVTVRLVEVGPAHTAGDVIVEVPDRSACFTGDILFIGGTPIVWAGPVSNWVAACNRILDAGWDTVVPGHGPLATTDTIAAMRDYLTWVHAEARQRFDAGMSAWDAARDIDVSQWAAWGEGERIAVNVDTCYAEFDPNHERANVVEQFNRMAALARP